MSFGVIAVSKRLAEAGISHLVTAGGNIVVEAYDPKAMMGKPIKVVKTKTGWVTTRSKKQVPAREAYKILMKLKRELGYGKQEKKMAALREDKAPNPNRSKGAKKGWKSSPLLKEIHKNAQKAAPKKSAKPAAKKVVKTVKKVAKKVVKPAGKRRL